MTYAEKLKDPRWQKKRLEIMQRDQWTCRLCGSTTETLNVHHVYYEKGFDVWQYPDFALLTLCEECHQKTEIALRQLRLSTSQVSPVVLSGFAVDLTNCVMHEESALTLFSWLMNNPSILDVVVKMKEDAEDRAMANLPKEVAQA